MTEPRTPRVFFDTSVVIAGSFSRTGASFLLLQLAGLGLLDGRICPAVRAEAERNIADKLPSALPSLRVILREALTEGASPSEEEVAALAAFAHAKDAPILASAVGQGCRYLVTLNERDFHLPSGFVGIIRPGDLVLRLRELLADLGQEP